MKELFSFDVNRVTEIEQKTEKDNQTIITKVNQEVPVKIILKSPSRAEIEESDLFYGVMFTKYSEMGLQTDAMVRKMYNEKGGFLSDKENDQLEQIKEDLEKSREEYFTSAKELEKIEDGEAKQLLELDLASKRNKIQSLFTLVRAYDQEYRSLFNNTADTKARNQSTFWWILFSPYVFENDKYTPLFGEGDFEERRENYDKLVESDDAFYSEAIKKVLLLVSLWATGQISEGEDFQAALDELYQQEVIIDKEEEEAKIIDDQPEPKEPEEKVEDAGK